MFKGRLTTDVVCQIEGLWDAFEQMFRGVPLTPEEAIDVRELRRAFHQLHQAAMDADEGVGLAVTMIRRGPDSPSLKRRMVERGLRVRQGGFDDQTAA